jgi:hypothetical protein
LYNVEASVVRAQTIQNQGSALNIDVPSGLAQNGLTLQQYTPHSPANAESNQRFLLWPYNVKYEDDHYNTWYQIINELTFKCFDIPNASKQVAPLNQFDPKSVSRQDWGADTQDWDNQLWSYDTGSKLIKNKNSGFVIDVPWSSHQSGQNLQQYPANDQPNQQWNLI